MVAQVPFTTVDTVAKGVRFVLENSNNFPLSTVRFIVVGSRLHIMAATLGVEPRASK